MTVSTDESTLPRFAGSRWGAAQVFVLEANSYRNDVVPMFNYDWFHGAPFEQQKREATWRCVLQHFPDIDPEKADDNPEAVKFHSELLERTLVYLRDGFSYEVRDMVHVDSKSHLVFECVPVDDQYKVGAFVVTVPFEEIVRVEIFAVHPSEKPDEMPQITGFRNHPDPGDSKQSDGRPGK